MAPCLDGSATHQGVGRRRQKLYCKTTMASSFFYLLDSISLVLQRCGIGGPRHRPRLCLIDGIQKLQVYGNTKLVIQQVNREFSLKEVALLLSHSCTEVDFF